MVPTQDQQTQFETALARATAKGIYVAGRGVLKATGQAFIAVSSSSGNGCYIVRIAGHALICTCPAATKSSNYCMHRAVARADIMERATHAAEAEAARATALIDAAEAEAIPVRRDTGPRLYRDTPPQPAWVASARAGAQSGLKEAM